MLHDFRVMCGRAGCKGGRVQNLMVVERDLSSLEVMLCFDKAAAATADLQDHHSRSMIMLLVLALALATTYPEYNCVLFLQKKVSA